MHIGFVGSPCSGKTTTAAMLFASLKEAGYICEFSIEQARLFIAEKRFNDAIRQGNLLLTNENQEEIMRRQLHTDSILQWISYGKTITISDSSPLGALFYMTPEYIQHPTIQNYIKKTCLICDFLFYSDLVHTCSEYQIEPNRVHDYTQAQEIDGKIYNTLKTYSPEIIPKLIPLSGPPLQRHSKALQIILQEMNSCP